MKDTSKRKCKHHSTSTHSIRRRTDENDARRYKELYGIDTNDYGFVNLVIDIENLTADEVVDNVINGFKLWKEGKYS